MKIVSFFFKKKRIQIHILSIFLLLLGISAFSITRYTYREYAKDIEDLSHSMINQITDLLSEKLTSVKNEVQLVNEVVKGSIQTKEEVLGLDPSYARFVINILRNDPLITEITLATPSGDYFAVMSVNLENTTHFYSRPLDKIPECSKYIVRTVHPEMAPPQEVWEYVNEEGQILATESINPASYDFKNDPWIEEMVKDPRLRWANEILPRGTEKYQKNRAHSITISDVIKDSNGNIFAIFSMGVTLKNLSEFILNQKISGNGAAFVLDDKGDIKVPVSYVLTPSGIFGKNLIEDAYKQFKETGEKNFSMIQDGKKYLFSIRNTFVFSDSKWSVVLIIPFDDLFELTIVTQKRTRLMALLIMVSCAIAIYFSSQYFSEPIVRLAKAVDRIRDFDFSSQVPIESRIKEIFDLEYSVNAMRTALDSFGRYVPKELVKTLIKQGQDVHLGGERAELTMIFSDVQNFTTISESLPIEQLMTILSDYFDVISKIVLRSGGTIDKYIGDSLMAFWGAPLKITDHAEKACLACLQCLAAIKLQNKWITRFGIHTG
ncbi:MAG: adenylate/guanylate cyclase domain-containing protein, partial [Verrucomicrobia bacterium]|nr:adenylate/guanylate cyclase domain-containing protein [Verrucomicrobiota bacterium]